MTTTITIVNAKVAKVQVGDNARLVQLAQPLATQANWAGITAAIAQMTPKVETFPLTRRDGKPIPPTPKVKSADQVKVEAYYAGAEPAKKTPLGVMGATVKPDAVLRDDKGRNMAASSVEEVKSPQIDRLEKVLVAQRPPVQAPAPVAVGPASGKPVQSDMRLHAVCRREGITPQVFIAKATELGIITTANGAPITTGMNILRPADVATVLAALKNGG